MCRLIAIRSRHAAQFTAELIGAGNSLFCQSRCDAMQRSHPHGWGIAAFHRQQIEWARGVLPATECPDFAKAASQVCSETIFAHVRKASRGSINLQNTHPFVDRGWMFMHNGTLTAFNDLQPQLLAEIPSHDRERIMGQTDSECMFHWLLAKLRRDKIIQGHKCLSLSRLRTTLAAATRALHERNQAARSGASGGPAKLNFLLSNGEVLLGTRFDNSLWYHVQRHPSSNAAQVCLVASEPTDDRDWIEVPNHSVFSLSARWRWELDPL